MTMSEGVELIDGSAERWQPVFEAVLHQILKEFEGTDPQVRDGMESGMRKLFAAPYEAEFQILYDEVEAPNGRLEAPTPPGGAAGGASSAARRILFAPRPTDMWYYAAAFAREAPEKTAKKERAMKFKMMSVYYTVHRKDEALRERFLHYGGASSLVVLLAEEHNIIQSQAVELLLETLSPIMMLQPAIGMHQELIYHQVYLCLRAPAFFRNIGKIIFEPFELFPKSHENCLKLMAGAVGWLRPQEEGAAMQEGNFPADSEVCNALQAFIDGNVRVHPQVRGLAEELLLELREKPPIRCDPMPDSARRAAARATILAPDAAIREDAAHAWRFLRELGKEMFKAGKHAYAEGVYKIALEEGGDASSPAEASLVESNRALALSKLGRHPEAAAAAATALEHDPNNAKAAYRRALALLEAPSMTGDEVQLALAAAEFAAVLEPKDAQVSELLSRARLRSPSVPTADKTLPLDAMD